MARHTGPFDPKYTKSVILLGTIGFFAVLVTYLMTREIIKACI